MLKCFDTNNGSVDTAGDPCSDYYAFPNWCDSYDHASFTSSLMCCACNGGEEREVEEIPCFDTNFNGEADSYGDPCSDYYGHTGWCGLYDDDDFVSAEMCCACNGGNDGIELNMQLDPFVPSWLSSLSPNDKYVWDGLTAE